MCSRLNHLRVVMRKTIETAPRNGVFVILEDVSHGTFAVARWSGETAQWLDDDDKPLQFNATHWHLPQSLNGEAAPPPPDTPEPQPSVAAGGTTAEPPVATEPVRSPAADSRVARRPYSIVAMAACLLVGVAVAPLLYRSDAGIQLLHWVGSDNDSGLKEALEQERTRATKLAGDVTIANEAAARAREAGDRTLAGLREALVGEQSRAEKLAGQLAEAQRDGAAQTARARETMGDAAKERDRVVDELREALKAQEAQTTEVRRKIEAETAQAKQTGMLMAEALQQERDKVEELRLALAALRREAEAQAATARSANGEVTRLKEANERAADTLRETQGRTDKLATELAAARREVEAQASVIDSAKAQAAGLKAAAERGADEQRRALLQERDKSGKLTAELAEARSGLQAQTKAKAADDVVRDNHLAEVQSELQKANADAAAARDALRVERARAEQAELLAAEAIVQSQEYRLQAPAALAAARSSAASLSTAVAQTSTPVADAAQPPRSVVRSEVSAEHAVRLIARANLLLDQGHIGAARNMLDRAAELGSAEALFWLAETYDPLLLPARNAVGTQSDIARARALYGQALAAGIGEAKLRLESLDK